MVSYTRSLWYILHTYIYAIYNTTSLVYSCHVRPYVGYLLTYMSIVANDADLFHSRRPLWQTIQFVMHSLSLERRRKMAITVLCQITGVGERKGSNANRNRLPRKPLTGRIDIFAGFFLFLFIKLYQVSLFGMGVIYFSHVDTLLIYSTVCIFFYFIFFVLALFDRWTFGNWRVLFFGLFLFSSGTSCFLSKLAFFYSWKIKYLLYFYLCRNARLHLWSFTFVELCNRFICTFYIWNEFYDFFISCI